MEKVPGTAWKKFQERLSEERLHAYRSEEDMSNSDRQAREELTIFREFTKVCPLPLAVNTARNGPDPPDILCELESGETLAFELVQAEDVTSYNNASGETYVASVQKLDSDGGSTFAVVSPAIVERIDQKLTKQYQSDHKIHLLAWSDTATVKEFEGFGHRQELVELLQSNGTGPFDRIWIFGYGAKSIVFDSAGEDAKWKRFQEPLTVAMV